MSKVECHASIALSAAYRCVSSAAGSPTGARVRVRPSGSGATRSGQQMSVQGLHRKRAAQSSGRKPRPATASAGSNRRWCERLPPAEPAPRCAYDYRATKGGSGKTRHKGDGAEPAGAHASDPASCPAGASTGSGTTACWPTATAGTTWHWLASCCTWRRHSPRSRSTMCLPRRRRPSFACAARTPRRARSVDSARCRLRSRHGDELADDKPRRYRHRPRLHSASVELPDDSTDDGAASWSR